MSPSDLIDTSTMSEEEARRFKLEAQREILSSKYRLKCRLLELQRRGARVVYANQQTAATDIIAEFTRGKVWVVLVAPPGAGKTGVILEVLRLLGEHPDEKVQVLIEDMLVITGMSDTDWTKTMRDGLLDELAGTVHHRTMLGKRDNLDTMRNGIIVTDECHVACQLNQTIDKKLKEAGLKSIQTLKARNMRMLDVSATPEGVLADLKRWRDDTAVVVLQPDEKYKGFQSMKDEKRLLNARDYDLENYEDAKKLLQLLDDRYKNSATKKYFPFRLYSSVARGHIVSACHELGWGSKNHDSNERIEDIDSKMSEPPVKHEVIFVKGFWRASKRVVRKHVGGTYEAPTTRPDDTSKSQGLTARFCNTFEWDGDQLDVNLRPLHFDDVESIDRYLKWWASDCNYKEAAYLAPRLRSDGKGGIKHPKTKVDPSSVQGVEELPAEVRGPSFRISLQTFDSVEAAKRWWKDPESVKTEPHDIRFGITKYNIYTVDGVKCIKYRGGNRRLITEVEARTPRTEIGGHITNSTPARIMPVTVGQDLGREGSGVARILPVIATDMQWGIASSSRIMPVETSSQAIKYIVVYKPDAVYSPRTNSTASSDNEEVAEVNIPTA